MSSQRFRSLSLPRFAKSDLGKILNAKSVRRSASMETGKRYESLEARQLLTADVGLNFTATNGGSAFTSGTNVPNIAVAVGSEHVVQLLNDGYAIFDKTDGTIVENNNGALSGLTDNSSQHRIVFDTAFDRWYAVGVADDNSSILLFASNTNDPTGTWKNASLDVGDATSNVTLSVDNESLTIGAIDDGLTFVASIPQVALFGGAIESERFNIISAPIDPDDSAGGLGHEFQVGFDGTLAPATFPVTTTTPIFGVAINGDDGVTFPEGELGEGSQIVLTEIDRGGVPNVNLELAITETTPIDVPFFREPDVVRQPGDILRDRNQLVFNSTVAKEGNFLYAVHAVRGGADNLGDHSVLRWYKIDVVSKEVVDSGPIEFESTEIDLINPSIAVSPNGAVAIGYTATGPNTFPSSYVSVGVPSGGVGSPLAFNDPTEVRAGGSTYFDTTSHLWGRYSATVVDPFNSERFWTFQQFTDANNNWAIQATEFGPSDVNPEIEVETPDLDNIIELNQNGEDIEVVVDGEVVGVYDAAAIGTLTVDGNGGVDQFIVNIVDLDAAEINGSYILVGDGNDTLRSNATSDTEWNFDGANGVNINNGRILASGMVEFSSGEGNDRFAFPTSNYDFPVFAGGGNDAFVVEQDITGNLQLFGEVGDDDYSIPNSSFAGLSITDSVGSENDRLTTAGTEDQDTIVVGETEVTVNGNLVPFDDALNLWGLETFGVDGLGEDDVFEVLTTTSGITLFGQRGNDIFNIAETADTTGGAAELVIFGGSGDNSLNVTQNDSIEAGTIVVDNETISGMSSGVIRFSAVEGSFNETTDSSGITIFGSDTRADVIEIVGVAAGNKLTARGGSFDDRFVFENVIDGDAELIGDAGNDRFETNVASIFGVTVTDSPDSEMDVLHVEMTAGNDTIEVNEAGYVFNGVSYPTADASFSGIENFALDGAGGDDVFNITTTTTVASFFGSGGDDTFNVTDLTETSGGSEMSIDGGEGINEIFVERNESDAMQVVINDSTITGMTLATINYVSTGGFTGLVSLNGSDVTDDFVVETLLPLTLLQINAAGGDDTMLVERAVAGSVDLSGGDGANTYRVEIGGDRVRPVRLIDSAVNDDDDRAEIVFTTGTDIIDVESRVVGLGNDFVDVDPDIAVLALEGLGGDDQFNVVDPSNARIELFGQAGDDSYDILSLGALSSEIAVFDSVGSESDTLRVLGTINLDEFIVNESEVTINGNVLVPAGGNNIQGVENIVFDGLGGDDIFRINSTAREGFQYLGSEGNDLFLVTDVTAVNGADRFLIDGGAGFNEMIVSRAAILGGAEAGTEIMIEDNMIVGATAAAIDYQSTDGVFSLIEVNGSAAVGGNDDFDDIFRVNSLGSDTLLEINALGGNDVVDISAAAAGDIDIDGNLGNDSFLVALGGGLDRTVTVADSGVNEGFDRVDIFMSDADEVINITGNTDSFAVGSNIVNYDPTLEALAVHALGGNDRYIVSGTTTRELILAGGTGDDTYDLADVFGSTSVTIVDSENAENDRLTVDGTNDADTFEINENSFLINGSSFINPDNSNIVGIESFEVDGLDGDDTFIINSATRGFRLLGGEGNDSFNINDTAADAGFDRLVIDGGSGVNSMDIQRIEGVPHFMVIHETAILNAAKATIQYSATGGTFDAIVARGTDAVDDSFLVFGLLEGNSVQLSGAGGDDYYRVRTDVEGDVWADGQEGRDRYVFFLAEDRSRNLQVSDSGTGSEIDRINVFLTENSDEVVLDGPSVAVMDDTVSFEPTIETFEILAGDGDDNIDIRRFDGVRFFRIKGQDGDDVISSNGARNVQDVILIGDAGNDRFNLTSATDTGFFNVNGNAGDDTFTVGDGFLRNADLNGAEGDDRYDVSFADRGPRHLRIVDSGTAGDDRATVRATPAASRLTLRASGINSPVQLVGTTRRLESVELIGNDERDLVRMFAAPSANTSIDTRTGADLVTINSTNGGENLNIDLGAERDVANIFSTAPETALTLNTGRDNDLVNLGSTFAADSGSLDSLLGSLNIDLGQGSDRIYVNDSSSFGTHNYILTDSQLINDDSVRSRLFGGLTYKGSEFLQLRSNAQFGRFTVTPSATTRFLLDGNLPETNRLTLTGSEDGRRLIRRGEFAGTWLFDDLRDVQFEQFAIR